MSAGNLVLSSGVTLTPEDIRKISEESKKIIVSESKELSEFRETFSLDRLTSLPGIFQNGNTYDLVRVGLDLLKGLNGKSIELSKSSTAIQWRYIGEANWNVLVELSLLRGPKGNTGDSPIFSAGNIFTLPYGANAVADIKLVETIDGVPHYEIELGIPEGRPGKNGNGEGNVSVPTENIKVGKSYVFTATLDGSADGKFTELEGLSFGVGQNYPGYIHAEIFNDYENNIASDDYAHAEGHETVAAGPSAHAEGYRGRVYGANSHAEGRETWCVAPYAHVEGFYSICAGATSHVEGQAVSNGTGGHLVGGPVILADEEIIRTFVGQYGYSNSYFDNTYVFHLKDDVLNTYIIHMALGEGCHVEGANNFVCDNTSHVEGFNNICGDLYYAHSASTVHKANHIEGRDNMLYSGLKVDTQNYCVHIEGAYNTVYGNCSYTHVGGQHNIVGSPSNNGVNEPAKSVFCHGDNLKVLINNGVAFGKYNATEVDSIEVLFAYGVGASNTTRENAFSILSDGTVDIPKLKGGNPQDLINTAVAPLLSRIEALESTVIRQSGQIADLLELLQSGTGMKRAFVVGDILVITNNIPTEIQGQTLIITDSLISVSNNILILK